jgi:uncharacterized membrane protein YbhN (UPF0104 family)
MRSYASSLLKIAVTVIALGFVLWSVALREVIDIFANVQWSWAVAAFLLVVMSLFLRAFRWDLLLQGLGIIIKYGRLVELYFVGNFFNAFLPSGFGGDAVRIFEIARDVPANIAAGTVLVDRLTGLVMLFVMALLALPFRPDSFPDRLAMLVAIVSVVGIGASIILLDGSLIRRLGSRLPALLAPSGDGPVAQVLNAVQGCGKGAVARALIVSTIFNLILVAWWSVAGKALALDVPYAYYLLVVPILSVALLIPSIGGLGVRESLAPLLFVGAGVAQAEAVALSLLVFIIMRAASLIGAPVYIGVSIRDGRKKAAESG